MNDISNRIRNLSPAKRRLLEQHLQTELARRSEARPQPLGLERLARAPASFVQEELWLANRSRRGGFAYNVPMLHARLHGRLDVAALQRAVHEIVARHDTLRTRFKVEAGTLWQIIEPSEPLVMVYSELGAASEDRDQQTRRIVREEAQRVFDLATGPLFRVSLVRVAANEHLLLATAHHAVVDAWSIGVFLKELGALYGAFAAGRTSPLPPLAVHYAAIAKQERERHADERKSSLEYWRVQLGALPRLRLPRAAKPSANEAAHTGAHELFSIGSRLTDEIMAFSRRYAVTPQMTLLAAFQVVLGRLCEQGDFAVGLPIANRDRRELDGVIGLFAGQLVIRARLERQCSFAQLVQHVRSTTLAAFEHKDVPFIEVAKLAAGPGARQGFIQVIFDFINQSIDRQIALPGIEVESLIGRDWFSEFLGVDLFMLLSQEKGVVQGCLGYNAATLSPAVVALLVTSYLSTLAAALAKPELPLVELPELATIAAAVTEPRAPRLVFAGSLASETLMRSVSFWLRELGIELPLEASPPAPILGQLLDPAGALAENRAGVNLLILGEHDIPANDAAQVHELLRALTASIERQGVEHVVALEAHVSEAVAAAIARIRGVSVVPFERLATQRARGTEQAGEFELALGTSLARRLRMLIEPPLKVIVTDCDGSLWGGVAAEAEHHELSLTEPYLGLQRRLCEQTKQGVLLCLCSKSAPEDVWRVFDGRSEMLLSREHITLSYLGDRPKSESLKALSAELGLSLSSFVLIDDDPVELAEVRSNCPEVSLLELPQEPAERGAFLEHVWLFDRPPPTVEDRQRTVLWREAAGRRALEVEATSFADFIAGLGLRIRIQPLELEQLARAAQLSARVTRFNARPEMASAATLAAKLTQANDCLLTVSVSDRFGDYGHVGQIAYAVRGETLVVTTFLLSCRALNRGVEYQMLAHLGKLAVARGCRHLEFEFSATARNEAVQAFFAAARGEPSDRTPAGARTFRFAAESASDARFEPARTTSQDTRTPVSAAAQGRGVDPARFTKVALGCTSLESIRDAIKGYRSRRRPALPVTLALPTTELETAIAELWMEILDLDEVGVHDDFFDLGGSSLQALSLVERLCAQQDVELPPAAMFDGASVSHLARWIEVERATRAPGPNAALAKLVPLSAEVGAARPRMVCVHGLDGGVSMYGPLARQLASDYSVSGLRLRSEIVPPLDIDLETLAREHAALLLQTHPQGVRSLVGWSAGGLLAYELARQLRDAGRAVETLYLIDTFPGQVGAGNAASTYSSGPLLEVLFSLGRFMQCDFRGAFAEVQELPSSRRRTAMYAIFERESAAWLVSYLVTSAGLGVDEAGSLARELVPLSKNEQAERVSALAAERGIPRELATPARLLVNVDVQQRLLLAALEYRARPSDQKVVLILPEANSVRAEDRYRATMEAAWGSLLARPAVVARVPGNHFTLLAEPNVERTARVLVSTEAQQ